MILSIQENASSVNTITGTSADVNAVYTAGAAGTITGLNNEAVTLTDTTLSAPVLLTIDAQTSGVVNAVAATNIVGTFPEVFTTYTSNVNATIVGLGNEAITITAPLTVAQFNSLAAQTTGVITATIIEGNIATLDALTETGHALLINVTDASVAAASLNTLNAKTTASIILTSQTITGTAADVNTVYTAGAAGTITGLGNEAVTLTDGITVPQQTQLML